jgi:hypothetical protein
VNAFLETVGNECNSHGESDQSKGKFLLIVYYTGHGHLSDGTTRAHIWKSDNYPIEVKLRNFSIEHANNSFVLGIFDACRNVENLQDPGALV